MIAKGLPTAAIEFISDFNLADVFRILVAQLVGIRSFIGKPYLRGSTSPSNQKVAASGGATRLACRNLMRRSPDHAMRGMVRPVQRKSQLFGISTVSTT